MFRRLLQLPLGLWYGPACQMMLILHGTKLILAIVSHFSSLKKKKKNPIESVICKIIIAGKLEFCDSTFVDAK